MIFYHASPTRHKILKPLKSEPQFNQELNHQEMVWFSSKFDYTVFMVLFRCIEKQYHKEYRFFDFQKKALFYPNQYGPLLNNQSLFKKLYQESKLLVLKDKCVVYVHEIKEPIPNLQKTKWGDYYTSEFVRVNNIISIKDASAYLKGKGWEVKIL